MLTPKGRSRLIIVLALVFLTLLTFTLYHREGERGVVHRLQGYAQEGLNLVSRPFVSVFQGIRGTFNFFIHLRKIERENRDLKREIDYLKIKVKKINELEAENERLKKLLEFRESSELKLVPAKVIGFSPREDEYVLIIDKGSGDGLRENAAVITPEGLVGKLSEVKTNFSLVQLILDPDVQVSVRLVRSREVGILKAIEGELRIRLLSKEADVRKGDEVITSGLGSVFPEGLYVGEVGEVREDPNSVEKKIWVDSAVPFDTLEEVFVVKKK